MSLIFNAARVDVSTKQGQAAAARSVGAQPSEQAADGCNANCLPLRKTVRHQNKQLMTMGVKRTMRGWGINP
jgi:hypothetical protein